METTTDTLTSTATAQFDRVFLTAIKPGPWNPRKHKNPARQAELEASVKAHGVLQPIVLRAPKTGDAPFLIVAGSSRFDAAHAAGLNDIPAMVHDELTDAQCQEIACLENLNRTDLHPLDEAEAFARLRKVDRAYTEAAIAARFGKSDSYVRRRLSLLNLPPVVKEAFLEDVITAAHAEKLAKLKPADALDAFSCACFFKIDNADVLAAAKAGDWSQLREWVMSPQSLQAWLDNNCRLDLDDPDQQARLPGLVEVATAMKAGQAVDVVEVSREWNLDARERKLLKGVLSRSEYLTIDPKHGYDREKKTCPSAERALIVHGGRPGFLQICRNKECEVHHPKPKPEPARSASAGKTEKRKLQPWELQEQKRRKQQAAYAKLKAAVLRAMAPSLLKASLNAALVRDIIGGFNIADVSKRFGIALSDKTAVAVLLANHVSEEAWSRASLAKLGKQLGFDLAKFERDAAKAAAAKAKAAGTPKAKKTPAKAAPAKGKKAVAKKGKAAA